MRIFHKLPKKNIINFNFYKQFSLQIKPSIFPSLNKLFCIKRNIIDLIQFLLINNVIAYKRLYLNSVIIRW